MRIPNIAAATRITKRGLSETFNTRGIHSTPFRAAVTNFQMPAMSPTMTEGGIASWKKKDGESFAAGDVLLEIETDKATIDVEAQDDGIMGKILAPDGSKNVSVGKIIALIAEEGDDISNLEAPKEEATAAKKVETVSESKQSEQPPKTTEEATASTSAISSSPHSHTPPKHFRPLFPSVARILVENSIEDAEKIKGTGVRGMLTKGDVLAFLGKASGPMGTEKMQMSSPQQKPIAKDAPPKPLDGPAIRKLIVNNMLQASIKARNASSTLPATALDFDFVIADYLPPASSLPNPAPHSTTTPPKRKDDFLDGLI